MPDARRAEMFPTRPELLGLESSTASLIEVLQSIVKDHSITAHNRELARLALASAERNLVKLREVLARSELEAGRRAGHDVRRDLSVELGYAPADWPPHDAQREDS